MFMFFDKYELLALNKAVKDGGCIGKVSNLPQSMRDHIHLVLTTAFGRIDGEYAKDIPVFVNELFPHRVYIELTDAKMWLNLDFRGPFLSKGKQVRDELLAEPHVRMTLKACAVIWSQTKGPYGQFLKEWADANLQIEESDPVEESGSEVLIKGKRSVLLS